MRPWDAVAIAGIAELKPLRRTEGVTTLELIAEVSRRAVEDAGFEPGHIDGLIVGPQVGETPQHVPATVSEYLGLRPTMSNVVDLGGASRPGMVWRAAAAIGAGMCDTVLCVLANHRNRSPRGRQTAIRFVNSMCPLAHPGRISHMPY